ncbi:hypothetical protein [Auraticoccus monumenti]|uniref:hypothetical protein n=1 Tax=Auraticoccus monumenti TaxID=675864 RepID=UPI000B82A198|nr:hypothetical protein [Auraticoccus monumenti]
MHPFTSAFAEALDRRGATLSWLHEQLVERGNPVSVASLSYWRSGQRVPERASSRDALPDLEDLLHLPQGHLSRTVSTSRRVAPQRPGVMIGTLEQAREPIRRALAELDLEDPLNGLQEVHVHSVLDIGADGRPRRNSLRRLFRATRPDIDRFAHVEVVDPRSGARPRLLDLLECAEGRVVSYPESGVHVTEMLLPRPLGQGETALVQHDADLSEVWPAAPELSQHVLRPVRELLLWVRFDPDWVPGTWETRVQTTTDLTVLPRDTVAESAVHLALRNFGPGQAVVRWSVEPRPQPA